MQIERDSWILVSALSPELVAAWADHKRVALTDPDFRRLYLACDEAFDWDPDDPRLNDLAALMTEWSVSHPHLAGDEADETESEVSAAVELMTADVAAASPAWERLGEMVPERLDSE